MERDQEFVEYVVKAIVNNPQDVRSERKIDERGVLITLHINPADMGYVIGHSGETARAIRRLLKTVGAKSNARVNLKIAEPEGSAGPRSRRPAEQPYNPDAPVADMVADVADIDTSDLNNLKI